MNKQEINTFIEVMEEIGDVWTPEQVQDTYGDVELKSAISDRRSQLNQFTDIIGKVINN